MVKTIYLPERDYELEDMDFLTLLFDSSISLTKEDTILHGEADNTDNTLTKAQTRFYTKTIAHLLRSEYGIGANEAGKDVVVCISSGQILLAAALYGTIAAGGIYSSASYSFTSQELTRQIMQGGAVLLITSPDYATVARKAAQESGLASDRILVIESTNGKRCLTKHCGENLLNKPAQLLDWEVVKDRKTLRSRPLCLLYSSGTFGAPEGMAITHWNLGYFTLPACLGGTVWWMPKFDFGKFIEYNSKFRVTFFFTVPPNYLLIANSDRVTDQFKFLVHVISGAAPMGRELTAQAEKKLGCSIGQVWGLTETIGAVTHQPWDQHDETGSISPVMSNMRILLVDDDENDVEDGKDGEIIVAGPTIVRGYWKNPKSSVESFTKGGKWFKTGDIGVRRNNMLYIIDRKKELIKHKGLQIAPAELEGLLLSHPAIFDAAVVGVPDPEMEGNELPQAYVVADKANADEREIKDFIKRNMASHKQLRGGVVYIDVIPKNTAGKILRRELRELSKRVLGPKF